MKRVALFVGVDRYEDGAFRDLRYSIADAAALAAAFGRYGYKTHVATNPGNRALLDEVERRTAGLGPGDVFVFFFAGHGYTGSGGEHLLICRDDRLLGLRHNRAGVPVDLLGDLTNGKGFHRAFLLDACRTDVFSGVEGRGAAGTRDLGLVAMPDAGKYPGTCCVVRSCDRFCPALEFEDLGHGVFTQAVLDFLSEPEGRAVRMGEAFAGGVRERMREILRREGSVAEQTPTFQSNGAAFALFGEERVPGAWAGPDDTGAGGDSEMETLRAEMARLRAEMARMEAEREKGQAEAPAPPAPVRMTVVRKAVEGGRRAGETKTIVLPGGVKMEMAWCPPGEFMMGSPAGEEGRWAFGETLHRVALTKGFWMAKYPVTQKQWRSVMRNNPATQNRGENQPVENVNWNDCMEFCRKAGNGLTLPTEAQWEYACRAGSSGAYGGTGRLVDMGWYLGNSRGNSGIGTHPVGKKRANAWGLYDMHGNVHEWCADCWVKYKGDPETDPLGVASVTALGDGFERFRVLRGGSCWVPAEHCRSASRHGAYPDDRGMDYGFRPVVLQD